MDPQSEILMNASETLSDAQLAAVELFKGYPDGLLKFVTASCVIFMFVGIPGNIITIVALARYEKVRNATAVFIMNLSFSDFLFCCFNLPLTISTFHHRAWTYGQFLCRIFPLIRYALVANSLFTVIAITINRYIMIANPKLYTKLYKKRNIIIMLLCTWIIPFGIMIPVVYEKFGRFGLDVNIGSCSILKDHTDRSPKKAFILITFILPCIAIIICYARIFCIVRKAAKKSLNTVREVHNPEKSSSSDLSKSAPVCVSGGTDKYSTESVQNDNISSGTIDATDQSTNITIQMSEIISKSDEIKIEQPRLYRTGLQKSMKFLKMSLPTRKDRRLGSIIIAIMITYCICYLPMMIIKALHEDNPNPISNVAAHILFYLSSCINPIIYVVMSNTYRKAYTNLFKR